MKASGNKVPQSSLGNFRFRVLGGKVVMTNDAGAHLLLDKDVFDKFVAGQLETTHDKYQELLEIGAIQGGVSAEELAERYKNKNIFLFQGPQLFIVVATLRCNMKCTYCHASAARPGHSEYDMRPETAKRVVDTIFDSPSVNLGIEFQGGEPLLNWEAVKFITEYAIEQNVMIKRNLLLTLVTNMMLLDDEKIDYLINHKVGICTSLDGPEFLHNHNRGGGYRTVVRNLKKAMRKYSDAFEGYQPGALTTVTRKSLSYHKEIIDTYANLNLRAIHLRAMNPVGFASSMLDDIYYTPEEFLDFYEKALDYIITLNQRGAHLIERTAWLYLMKIFAETDPNYMDLRSPCGAGIGQIAFNYNGDVYTCDEGRMLAMQGDTSFQMGNVASHSYDELINSPIVRQTCLASMLDGIPRCAECAYKPFCGVCPLLNYVEEGSLFARIPQNRRHKINEGIYDMIFKRLQDEAVKAVFMEWLERGIGTV
jgi:His-Xaa-Ser system radical SAM maturase HxsB